MGNIYRLGREYKDTGGITKSNDQFLRWINIPKSGMRNSPGIRSLKYTSLKVGVPAYVILVTHEISGGILNPWEDIVDLTMGKICYWGDAKHDSQNPEKRHTDFDGNKVLETIYDLILQNKRLIIPPILHFSKPKKGMVKFNGLCVMDKLELTWFEDQGHPIRNYRTFLTILDVEEVSIDWLHHLCTKNDINHIPIDSPKVWKDYLNGNVKKLNVWKSEIRTVSQQLPAENSEEAKILEDIAGLSAEDFEKITVAVLKQLFQVFNLPQVSHAV